MLFSVIYSVDAPEHENIDAFAPPQVEDLWEQTEGDEECEAWEHGQHRKWGAVLDRDQFDKFVSACSLYADRTPTMGSIGAPGCGYGWATAPSDSRCQCRLATRIRSGHLSIPSAVHSIA